MFLTRVHPAAQLRQQRVWYGIHTFKSVTAVNRVTLVRWRFVPHDGEK
jgi:catalase